MQPFEKLGAFWLGRVRDPAPGGSADELLLYDSRDLTTHAVCVGMTGSGKTGLCAVLLEEAAIDGIPAIVIDPKGDMGNLALTFPRLAPEDFRPWIDEGEAARAGRTADEEAAAVSERWRRGLADWGQDPSRIERLSRAADVAVYTPGSAAGAPLAVLRSLAAPPPAVRDDPDTLRERIAATVSALLALVRLPDDPIRGREHLLLANLLERAWTAGHDLDLARLIAEVAAPPFDRVGVLDLETFYPSRERSEMAFALNALLASPGFAAWTEGAPLDVQRLLWTVEGRPRLSILSIAHLSDAERMFFVTLVLNEVVSWMRAQPGTSTLRAILYMDEVFGYFPPVANPPSKTPMLTLLKQARAYGLGVVLATQNPVDLDYRGLSNAGTWFLGRLQTERDRSKVVEGLETAAPGGLDRGSLESALASLEGRTFLMRNVHENRPVVFQVRWALSWLRGPLTRDQVQALARSGSGSSPAGAERATPVAHHAPASTAAAPPALAAEIPQVHFAPSSPVGPLVYRPALVGTARLHYVRSRPPVDHWEELTLLAPLDEGETSAPWERASAMDAARSVAPPPRQALFETLPPEAARTESYERWSRDLAAFLYRERPLVLWSARVLGETSRPGESEGDFRARLAHAARERRDLERAKLEQRFAPKLARLRERTRRAEERVERERGQYDQARTQTTISIGATVLGALFGRKTLSAGNVGRATTAARGASRAAREREDIARAEASVERERESLAELESQLESELRRLQDDLDPASVELEELRVPPRKSDLRVERVALGWLPD